MSITIKSKKTKEGDSFAKAAGSMNDVVAKVGWFGKYPSTGNGAPQSVADIAILQEKGSASKNIPPRPFLQPTIDAKENAWRNQMIKGIKAVLRGTTSIENVMEIIGQTAKADIQKTIARVNSPVLAQSTIKARMRRAGMDSSNSSNYGKEYNFAKIKKAAAQGNAPILIDKPLIDTGYMFNSIINTVGKE